MLGLEGHHPDDDVAVVAEQAVVTVPYTVFIRKISEEGFWQQIKAGVDIDTDEDCKSRVANIYSFALKFALNTSRGYTQMEFCGVNTTSTLLPSSVYILQMC